MRLDVMNEVELGITMVEKVEAKRVAEVVRSAFGFVVEDEQR